MVKRSKKPKKKASRRLNPPLPPGITRETIASFKKCSEIYDSGYGDYGDIEKIKLCMFYSRLSERLREQGYTYENGYKISLHNCRESTLPADITSLPPPDFHRPGPKPPGIWFSDFYEIDSSSDESRVLERPNTSKSWTEWCIDEGMDWSNPNKCTHILIAKMKEIDYGSRDFTTSDILRIDSEVSYKRFNNSYAEGPVNIHWGVLSEFYGGISIPNVHIGGYGFGWLSMWDVASYVVWNTREGFEDLQIFALSEFQDLVDDYNNLDVDQLEEIANQSESEASSRSSSVTSRGRTVSPRGRTVSPRGRTVSPRGRTVSPRGRTVSPRGRTVSPRGRTVSPRGRTVSPWKTSRRKVSPSPVRRSSRRKERGRSPTVKPRRGKKK